MSALPEITVPQTKPATEWVRGRALRKLSPQERHARAQLGFGSILLAWARAAGLGRVGSEWEFRVAPPGEPARPLVPDIAYLSYRRLGPGQSEEAQIPGLAPDVAVEILSPGDRRPDIDEKILVYLAAGAALVLLIDPIERSFTAHDVERVERFSRDKTFTHPSLPGFSTQVDAIFA